MDEIDILFTIYDQSKIKNSFTKSETPDFILTDPINNLKIGVEITTLYSHQASAILKDDRFKDKFIKENKPNFKSKKKPKYLKRLNTTILEGGVDFSQIVGHGIWYTADANDFFDFFENIIKKKNKSYEFLDGLEFVNLIAKDEENFAKSNKVNPGEIYGYLRNHSLFKTIISSNFQEIYLISEFHSGTYNIPLKWYIFHSEYELFINFWNNHLNIDSKQKNDLDLQLKNFCVCLILLGFERVYFFYDMSGNKYIVFGNTYWRINLEKKLIEEETFLGKSLEKKNEMRNILKNYENYTNIFNLYLKFRNTLVPNFKDDFFIKISLNNSM
ncbi:MAG: hypothetical protein WAV86_14540 [Lutibacter sp.]